MVTERKPQPPSPPPQPVGARPSPRTWRAAYSNNSKQQNNRRNGSRGSIVAVAWFAAVATLAFASIYVSLFRFPDGGGGGTGGGGRRRHLLYYYYGGGSSAAGEGGSGQRRRRKIPTPSSLVDGIEPNYDRINNIAWLLSFPNSGTTYTLANTEHVTNVTTATNYDGEVLSEQIWPLNRKGGGKGVGGEDAPFLFSPHLPIGDRYTLTKTHCEGRSYCDDCHHTQAVQDAMAFELGCRRADIDVRLPAVPERSNRCRAKDRHLYYSPRRVLKVVHLVRNPFDNVVARMHLGVELRRREPERITRILSGREYALNGKGNKNLPDSSKIESLLGRFNDTRDGVLEWCNYVDSLFHDARSMYVNSPSAGIGGAGAANGGGGKGNLQFRGGQPNEAHSVRNVTIPPLLLDRMRRVPCHSEWFRYVQWHNLAIETYTRRLRTVSDAHVVYFEDYSLDPNATARGIAEYLEQPVAAETILPFKSGKAYRHLFSDRFMGDVAVLIRELATPECWDLLRRYFGNVDVDRYLNSTLAAAAAGDGAVPPLSSSSSPYGSWALPGSNGTHDEAAAADDGSEAADGESSGDDGEDEVLQQQQKDEFSDLTSKVVWLMAFPQSGSKLTASNVQRTTGADIASHHFQDIGPVQQSRNLQALFPDELHSPMLIPGGSYTPRYVLTRNQCTAFCPLCPPAELYRNFDRMCSSVQRKIGTNVTIGTYLRRKYVDSAILQVRNPFDVIRSRAMRGVVDMKNKLNLTSKEASKLRDKQPREAMLKWCEFIDSNFVEKDPGPPPPPGKAKPEGYNVLYRSLIRFRAWRKRRWRCPNLLFGPPKRYSLFRRNPNARVTAKSAIDYVLDRDHISTTYGGGAIPCYSEWLRYVQWHNYALQSLSGLPGYVLRFEHLVKDYEGTMLELVRYLNLTTADSDGNAYSPPRKFSPNRAEPRRPPLLYTPEEARRILKLVQDHSSDETWELVRRYFSAFSMIMNDEEGLLFVSS